MTPRTGPTFLVAGDAAGFVNPFNGEGISVAYETGRLAADAVDLALATGDGLALQTYEDRLAQVYGLYFKVARVFVRAIGNPAVMRELNLNPHEILEAIGEDLRRLPTFSGRDVRVSPTAKLPAAL